MGKSVARSVLFLSILLLLFVIISRALLLISKNNEDLLQSRNKSIVGIQKEPENTIDVLVVGDSLSYTSVSPMRLWQEQGITSYICGQNGQIIQETYNIVDTALKNQKPRVLLIETNVFFRKQTGYKGAKRVVTEKANQIFPMFRFHDVWKPLLMGMRYAEESYKGFMVRNTVVPYKGGEYMHQTEEKMDMDPLVKEYMDKIIKLCDKKDVKIVLVSSPSPLNYNYVKHNTIKQYAEEKSLKFLDLNLVISEIGIDWNRDSLDNGDHLNIAGGHKVTTYVGNYLSEKFDIPDHRDEEDFSSWNDYACLYEDRVKEKLDVINK